MELIVELTGRAGVAHWCPGSAHVSSRCAGSVASEACVAGRASDHVLDTPIWVRYNPDP